MNCQVYTFPWGIPGEATTRPESPIHAGLERPPTDYANSCAWRFAGPSDPGYLPSGSEAQDRKLEFTKFHHRGTETIIGFLPRLFSSVVFSSLS